MGKQEDFLRSLQGEFETDRLTYQSAVPTFHPEDVSEAARFFRLAGKQNQQLYISGFGNNIQPVGKSFEQLVVISTDRMNQLIEVSAQDLYVTTGAGYPLREINHRLKAHDLFVPHSNLPYVGSVGGALATGLEAEMNGHDVPLKKFFLKSEIVTPDGEVITPGSVCFKSVSGYDIVKVFAGSWGLLGLIMIATLRVIPLSGADEYEDLRQKETSRKSLVAGLAEDNTSIDAVYARKIKQKFDAQDILPIV